MIRPLGDRVLVREESEHGHHIEQHGLILIKDKVANDICFGKVVALGPKVSSSLGLKPGDKVHWEQHFGTPVGEQLLMLKQEHVALAGDGTVVGNKRDD